MVAEDTIMDSPDSGRDKVALLPPIRRKEGNHPMTSARKLRTRIAVVALVVLAAGVLAAPGGSAAARRKKVRVDALIAGGVDQFNGPIASAEAFNANKKRFTCVGGVNSATGLCNDTLTQGRFDASVAALEDGEILVAGGNGVGVLCLNSALLYNPTTNSFSPTGSMTDAHCFAHTTTVLLNGEVLITGGEDETGNLVNTADMYNPASGLFDCSNLGGVDPSTGYCKNTLTDARFLDTATLLQDGRVLIAGGNDGSIVNTAEIFDPASGTFGCSSLGGIDPNTGFCKNTMTDSRENHTSTLIVSGPSAGDVLIAGGLDAAGTILQTAELFDPSMGTFLCANGSAPGTLGCPPQMAQARYLHTATLLDPRYVKGRYRGDVLIAGGEDASGKVLSSAELFDPVAKTFTAVGSMTTARALQTATLITHGKKKGWVLIAGGIDNSGKSLTSAEFFNPRKGKFVPAGSMMIPRSSSDSATVIR
jgi:hypothetical protein